jgi:hypothetical protein
MEDFLPAFMVFGCTLPKLKAVSAWPPEDVDSMWVTKLREVVDRLRRERNAEKQEKLATGSSSSSGRADETNMNGIEVTNGEDREMRELTHMDGVILGYHLREFWKKWR